MSEFVIECWYDPDDGWIAGTYREEIVRCRDCVYMTNQKYKSYEYQMCSYFDSEYAEVEPDGYCAWSCRRSDKE